MVILAMDTSTDQLSLALGRDQGDLLASWTSVVPKMHATLLHPLLDEMLATVNLELKDLGAIILGIGPGSYTGVRIAVTAAKTFAYTLAIPVLTVSSLEAAAFVARAHQGLVVVAWDARRQAAYSAAFRVNPIGDRWERVLPDGRRDFSQLVKELEEIRLADEQILLLGNAALAIADLLQQAGDGGGISVYEKRTLLTGDMLLQLGLKKMQEQPELVALSNIADAAHELVPNYLQMVEAQARRMSETQGDGAGGVDGSSDFPTHDA